MLDGFGVGRFKALARKKREREICLYDIAGLVSPKQNFQTSSNWFSSECLKHGFGIPSFEDKQKFSKAVYKRLEIVPKHIYNVCASSIREELFNIYKVEIDILREREDAILKLSTREKEILGLS